jgi:hypothetical protein
MKGEILKIIREGEEIGSHTTSRKYDVSGGCITVEKEREGQLQDQIQP